MCSETIGIIHWNCRLASVMLYLSITVKCELFMIYRAITDDLWATIIKWKVVNYSLVVKLLIPVYCTGAVIITSHHDIITLQYAANTVAIRLEADITRGGNSWKVFSWKWMSSFGASKLVGCQYVMIDIFLIGVASQHPQDTRWEHYTSGPPEKISTVWDEMRQYLLIIPATWDSSSGWCLPWKPCS